MKYQINYENAMSNHGNWDRICRVTERASAGESCYWFSGRFDHDGIAV